MAKFPTYEEMAKNIAEKALNEFQYDGRSIREWAQIIASEDCISRQAAIDAIKKIHPVDAEYDCTLYDKIDVMYVLKDLPSIKALEQEPCEDAISRADAIRIASGYCHPANIAKELEKLPSVQPEPNKGHCKDCKWWKDSDGMFRRGIDAESKCPINRKEVYEGNGYCFMFEPQESEE